MPDSIETPPNGGAMSPPALGNPAAKSGNKVEPDPPPPPPTPEPLKLERAVIENLFGKLDPTLTREAFNSIFLRAGTTEAQALETLFKSLRKLVLNASGPIDPVDVREMNAAMVTAIEGGVRGRVVSLGDLTVDALGTLISNEIGAPYSLNNALPFALLGSATLYEPHNRDNSLNKFDPSTGKRLMSDAYLRDRASYFAVRLAAGPGTAMVGVDGTQSWTFDDRRTAGVRLNASAANAERAGNRMTFGNGNPTTGCHGGAKAQARPRGRVVGVPPWFVRSRESFGKIYYPFR
jgi:hypothetical protein